MMFGYSVRETSGVFIVYRFVNYTYPSSDMDILVLHVKPPNKRYKSSIIGFNTRRCFFNAKSSRFCVNLFVSFRFWPKQM